MTYTPDFLATSAAAGDRDWALDLYDTFGRGGDEEALCYLLLPGDPWSKARPKFARGRAYQPRDDAAAESALRNVFTQHHSAPFPGNVMLACRFYRSNFQRIDADNLLKHVCDSANGALWRDDCQVTLVIAELHYDPAHPRTVVIAGNHSSTLVRGVDGYRACEGCGAKYKPHAGPRSGTQRFCSQACSHRARGHALAPIICRYCKKSFTPTNSYQVLCSPACRVEELRGRLKGRGGPLSRCSTCDKELAHRRGGRCRDCWRKDPSMLGIPPGADITIREVP